MAKIGGIKDKIVDAGHTVKDAAAAAPGKAVDKVKGAAENTKKGLKDRSKYVKKTKIDPKLNKLREFRDDPLKTTGKAALAGAKGGVGKVRDFATNVVQKQRELRRMVAAAQSAVAWIKNPAHLVFIKVFAIVAIVAVLLFNFIVFAIGVGQSVSISPHYYCDLEAPSSVKRSKVYQQYCTLKDLNWNVSNINGHYIVQDGKGPADSCAIANMLLRFYTIESGDLWFGTTNVYRYLWQGDGQYNINGTTFAQGDTEAGATATNFTIRAKLNNYTTASNTNENDPDVANGARAFAASQEISNFTMSNWGYLRDESIDIKSYKQTSDFYMADDENTKWVWDLSVGNMAEGSAWRADNATWNMSFRLNGTKFELEEMKCPTGDKGYAILKDRIINVLNTLSGKWTEYYKGRAGVILEYSVTGAENYKHTILLTKCKETSSGSGVYEWYGVDSSLGTSGGWEGPLNDPDGKFVADGVELSQLLNSSQQSLTIGANQYQVERIGYCVKPRFGFF